MQATREQVAMWLNHPITQGMIELVRQHKEANEKDLQEAILHGPSLTHVDLHLLSQLKGQILALEQVLNTKEFLLELIEEEADELSRVRAESISQGKEVRQDEGSDF